MVISYPIGDIKQSIGEEYQIGCLDLFSHDNRARKNIPNSKVAKENYKGGTYHTHMDIADDRLKWPGSQITKIVFLIKIPVLSF